MRQPKLKIELSDEYGVIYVDNSPFYFDKDDLAIINSKTWFKDKDGYLTHAYSYHGRVVYSRFHRIVMHAGQSQFVDHINKNRSDNRKQNLRLCSKSENMQNRGRFSTNSSGIIGVRYDKSRDKWIADITCKNKRIFIGRFDTKEDAVKARLTKEQELFREFAPQKELMEVYHAI